MKKERKGKEELSEKILNYLRKHPNAEDTVEGITRWWLEFEKVDSLVDDVSEVLELLLRRDMVIRVKYGDKYLYKLKKYI